ncbi:MAG: diacylglycerol/lipid kinase family protein [Spirochaetota bacterium]
MTSNLERAFECCSVIINPVRYPKRANTLKKVLAQYSPVEMIVSRNKQHFVRSVKDFCESKNRYLLVWGGDGTVHTAINTMVEQQGTSSKPGRKCLGFFRGGSGNGYHNSYEVPFSPVEQVQAFARSIASSFIMDVDLIKLHHAGMVSYGQLAGIGFDACALKKRETKKLFFRNHRTKRGLFNYVISTMLSFFSSYKEALGEYTVRLSGGMYFFSTPKVNVEVPFNHMEKKVTSPLIEIGKRPFYGDSFKVCPHTVCNSGWMDVYLYNFESKFDAGKAIVALWKGHHEALNRRFDRTGKPVIERFSVGDMRIESKDGFDYQIDGELFHCRNPVSGKYTLKISLVPGAVSLIVPEGFYRKFNIYGNST